MSQVGIRLTNSKWFLTSNTRRPIPRRNDGMYAVPGTATYSKSLCLGVPPSPRLSSPGGCCPWTGDHMPVNSDITTNRYPAHAEIFARMLLLRACAPKPIDVNRPHQHL